MDREKDKYNHIFRYLAVALYILGALLIIVGVIGVVTSISFEDSVNTSHKIETTFGDDKVIDDDFFDDDILDESDFYSSTKSFIIFGGIITLGGIMIFVATVFLIIDLYKSKSFKKMGKSLIDGLMGTIAYTKSSFESKVLDKDKPIPYYCEYCGSLIEESNSKCQSCGATKRQKV